MLKQSLALLILGMSLGMIGGCATTSAEGPPTPASESPSVSRWVKSSRPSARTVVVFIHGVMGDAHTTWRASANSVGWPELLGRDTSLPSLDVLSLGYRSPLISKASTIEEIAVRSLRQLRDDGVFTRYDNVIFVAHSMGGLVTKRFLRTLQSEDPAAFARTRAVAFFATPANGSGIAETAEWISANPQFRDMAPADFNSFLQLLENDWQSLLRNRSPAAPFPRSFCAYETLKVQGMQIIVPRSAAQAGCDETPVAFDRDHLSIVKPASADDEIHRYLRARILEALDQKTGMQRITAVIGKANSEPLRAGSALRDGDRFSLQLEATRGAWFYVYGVDSTDHVQRLFPSPAAGGQQAPLTSLRLPEKKSSYFILDQHKGVERIYIFARDEPDARLDSIGTALTNSGRDGQAVIEELASYFESLRGVAGVVPRSPGPDGATEIPNVLGGATEILIFEHR
jgi:pimeloyl-ACP methyl ester carboxylesterase